MQQWLRGFGGSGMVAGKMYDFYKLSEAAYGKSVKDNYGNEKIISKKDKDALQIMIPFALGADIGILPNDFNNISNRIVREATKNAQTRKQIEENYKKLLKD